MDFIDAEGSKPGNNLLVVDGLNLAFRYKYANKKVFAFEFIKTVESLANSYGARDIVVLGDGGSTYREALLPTYKGNRKELREKQTEQEADDFKDFINEFQNAFEQLGEMYYTFRFKGVEADDIAAYLVKKYSMKYEHIWLISSDRDWNLLLDENVSQFSYVTRKEFTVENWKEYYDYEVEDHISIKVLMGDKGDNVPGVPGIGPKRAATLIKEYGTAYDIYASLPIESTYKYIKSLNEFGDKLLLNYELMDLPTYCDEAIGKENIKMIDEGFGNG